MVKAQEVGRVLLDCLDYVRLTIFHFYTYAEFIWNRLFKPLKSLEDEVILVTGSGRGIGREICLALANTGAKIVCWSKSAGPNEEVVAQIKNLGGTAYAYTVDVSNKDKVEEVAILVQKEVGNVSIVINNAGLMRVKPFLDTTANDIESMFQVNVLSNFWVLKQFLPSMIKENHGHVVSVCSAAGILPTRNIVCYSSTKHAVTGYMDALRDELRNHPLKPDIKMTIAFPFYCTTEMLDDSIPNTRFPLLFSIDSPSVVAQNIVHGIRKEMEYIYSPRLVGWLAMCSWLVPPKTVEAYADFLKLNIDPVKPKSMTNGNGNHHNYNNHNKHH